VKKLTCIIIDDEHLARARFRTLLQRCASEFEDFFLEIIGEAENGTQAIPLIYAEKPDIIFIDIQMPGLNGFEIVELISTPRPQIIFVTAYDEYALRAFDVHALDYLTKPVSKERLYKTLQRIINYGAAQQSEKIEALIQEHSTSILSRITVHSNGNLRVVAANEIRRIEAEDKNVFVYIHEGKFKTDYTVDVLEQRLSPHDFIRVHRSHLVKIDAIRELIPWFSGSYCVKLDDSTQLPVARRRVAEIKKIFGS
jgi:DNA-binding LytR/AlgR family response regulator